MDELMLSNPVDVRGDRKRSGRPCIGGRGELWSQLLSLLLSGAANRTKNGLPGIPYAIRNTVQSLKVVWSLYAPAVTSGAAPADFLWLSTSATALVDAMTNDTTLSSAACSQHLYALADVARALGQRTSDAHVTAVQAPQALFTPALEEAYRLAGSRCCPTTLYPAPPVLRNYVSLPDVSRLLAFTLSTLEERARVGHTPELVRLLHWGTFVLTFLLPFAGEALPLDLLLKRERPGGVSVTAAAEDSPVPPPTPLTRPYIVDGLCVWRHAGGGEAPSYPAVSTEDGAYVVHLSRTLQAPVPRDGPAHKSLQWVLEQREGAAHGERLLPRRLTVDTVLRRLSTGAWSPVLKGRTLTGKLVLTAWTTDAFASVLSALDERLQALRLADADALDVLRLSVFPCTIQAVPPLHFPGDHVLASALLDTTGGMEVETS